MPELSISGRAVICDDGDLNLLSESGWKVDTDGRVLRILLEEGRYAGVELFHRVITDCPDGMVVDHINGNPSDNRRANLRICSQMQNTWNRKIHSNNSSGVRGVYFDPPKKRGNPWRAQIRHEGRKYSLGRFATKEQAEMARVEAERRLFGDFSPLPVRNENSVSTEKGERHAH